MTVERVLRGAADEVRATVVRDAVPPPLEGLDRSAPPWVRLVAVATLLVGFAALALVLAATSAPGPVEMSSGTAGDESVSAVSVCMDIDAVVRRLDERSDASVDDLAEVVGTLDRLRAATRRLTEITPSAEVHRRLDRFVALADLAVVAALDGPSSTAVERSWQAVALGEALLSAEPFDVCRPHDETSINQGG